MTDFVIKAVEKMAADQGIKGLEILGRNKLPLLPANWIAGVDYDDDIFEAFDEDYEEEDDAEDDDEEIDDEDLYDRVDPTELAEVLADRDAPIGNQAQANANPVDGDGSEAGDTNNVVSEDDEGGSEATEARRSGRTRRTVDRLTYSHATCAKAPPKRVIFADENQNRATFRYTPTLWSGE